MSKWEYLLVIAQYRPSSDKTTHVRYVNGKEIPNWEKGPTLTEYFQELGSKGWEMVSEYVTTEDDFDWEYTWRYADSQYKGFVGADKKRYEGISGHFEYFDVLGKANWELVSATPDSIAGGGLTLTYGGHTFVFKRKRVNCVGYRYIFKRTSS